MQPAGSEQVWVPDSVRADDQAWSVSEAAGRWENQFTGWCSSCARFPGPIEQPEVSR